MIAIVLAILLTGGSPSWPSSPAPDAEIGTALIGGNVGYGVPSHGRHYLAMRLPRGTLVRICGPGRCIVRVTNDYGPSSKIRPNRIADLSWWDWLTVCGEPDHSAGLCKASAEMLDRVEPPATDTAP